MTKMQIRLKILLMKIKVLTLKIYVKRRGNLSNQWKNLIAIVVACVVEIFKFSDSN